MKRPAKADWRHLASLFFDTFLLQNIVLVQAIGICPIIGAGVNLKYGVALTVCTAAVLLPTSLCMSLFGEKIPSWLRPPVYTVGASLLLLLAAFILDSFISTDVYAKLYLYLPLMAVNTIFTYRAGGFSVGSRPVPALIDAFGSACGFGLVVCIVSCLREIAISNTIWDIPLGIDLQLPEAGLPFAAFIMLGFMAAFLQWFKAVVSHRLHKKEGGTP